MCVCVCVCVSGFVYTQTYTDTGDTGERKRTTLNTRIQTHTHIHTRTRTRSAHFSPPTYPDQHNKPITLLTRAFMMRGGPGLVRLRDGVVHGCHAVADRCCETWMTRMRRVRQCLEDMAPVSRRAHLGTRVGYPTLDHVLHESAGVEVWRARVPASGLPCIVSPVPMSSSSPRSTPRLPPVDDGSGDVPVVVKRIDPVVANDTEVDVLESLRGADGFTQLLGSYRDPSDAAVCLVMPEYGLDLFDWIDANRTVPTGIGDVWRIAADVGRRLVYLHRRVGVAHLDVKPENILQRRTTHPWRKRRRRSTSSSSSLPDFGPAVVADFGCTRDLRDPRLRDVVGTDRYAAPELRGSGPVYLFSEKSDAYSLGLTVYVAVTRTYPRTRDPVALVRDLRERCASPTDVAAVEHGLGPWLQPRLTDRTTVEDGLRRVAAVTAATTTAATTTTTTTTASPPW